MIRSDKWQRLRARLQSLEVTEADLQERFVLGSGRGGQKKQKTHSCVQLNYPKANIDIRCQKTRSRDDNRYFARVILCEKLETLRDGKLSERERKAAKIRAQKRRRSRRGEAKRLADKQHTSERKATRKPPNDDG